ncbi:MAG: FKBP-type peptidyl-prolyl cis-trans isomerase [Sediminibacterium sp.]|nr:FKBP-type peptidyl-prolyl cis-trans isomerase [Sediminibacterium sp.]
MRRITIPLLSAVVLLASCNQYEKTPSGLAYKIEKGGSKELLKQGQFVKMNVEYKLPAKDSVLSSTFGRVPVYFRVDTSRISKHSFIELINKCAPGDKIDFVMNVDSLKKLGMLEYNEIFKQKDLINGKVEVIKTFANEEQMMADYQKELDNEKVRETKELKDFTAKKGAKVQETASGLFVEVTDAGDATLRADSGKQVSVLYRGTFLNGKKFDGNMDKDSPNKEPLSIVVGSGGVIRGLDEALRFFGKGGRGRVYIPALLGYGPNGSAPVIPPYAALVFDIEILDVANAAPGTVLPMMPQGPQGTPQR